VVTPDTTSPPNLAKSEESQQQQQQQHTITPVDTEQLMAPTPEVPNLQPLFMQFLAAQQHMLPKISAHERLGPVAPPPQQLGPTNNQQKKAKKNQYFRRYNGPPR